MSRLKLCLVVLIIVLAIGITAGVSVAFAAEPDLYIEVDISLTGDSVLHEDAVAQAKYWVSTDKKTWKEASEFQSSWIDLVYFNEEDMSRIGTVAPTAVGKYIVRAIVNGSYNKNNYFLSSTKLTEGLVLSSFSYQVVYENLAVIFAPNKNVDYQDGFNYASIVFDETKVYYKGEQLTKDTDYTVELAMLNGEVYENVAEAINPGMYRVTVRLNELYLGANITTDAQKSFVSTFEIVNSLANAVKLSSGKVYEDMYQSDEAMRADYYTVKYEGLITTEAFKDKYTVSYLSDNKTISAPTLVGDYTVRFTFTSNIDVYGITAGDFIDLPYTIHKKPYSVTAFESTAPTTDGYSLIYQGKAIAITPKFDKNLKIDSEKTAYYKYNDSGVKVQLTYGELPTEIGRYQVKFYIDLTNGDITSEEIFGVDDKDYAITNKNNELVYEFQIIPRMSVNFASNYDGEQGFSSIVDYTGKRAKVINSLQDSTLADIPVELYSIEYYDSDWNITDAIIPGEYTAVITFNINNETKTWTNGATVIQDQTKLYYNFKVAKRQATITAKKVSGGILLNFGPREIQPSDYDVKYYRFDNNLNYSSTQSELINVAGLYHILVSFKNNHYDLGIENGDVFVLDYENKAEGSLDIVTLSLDNAIDTGSGYTIKYDGNIKSVNIYFDNVSDELIQSLNYSFYYQKLNRNGNAELESDWTVCNYPKMPGYYRAVMVVNSSNINFNAKTGDKLTYYFTITALDLTPTFTVKIDEYTKDLVYDNNPNGKDFNVTFTSNGRPVIIDSSLYTLRYSKNVDGAFSTFTLDKPINAGNYIIAVYFNYGTDGAFEKYNIFTDEPTIINPEDFTIENMSVRSVFSSVVRVEKLVLTIVAGIPVEEKAMYRLDGGEIKPTYTYYKTNGYSDFTNYQELLAQLQNKGDEALTFIGEEHFDSELFTGSLNSISCDDLATESKETGRYVNNLSLKADIRNNIVFDKVLYNHVGAKANGEYTGELYNASKKSDYSLTVQYLIKPLPLIINSTDLESIVENGFAEHYYGNTAPITGDKLLFSTVDQDGTKYEIKNQFPSIYNSLSSYVSLRYYKRLTGESVIENNAIFVTDSMGNPNYDLGTVEGYLFNAGDYSLKITFENNNHSEYKNFTLVNGKDENGTSVNGNHIEGLNYADIEFTVKTANTLRVVFERNFNSFVYDGNAKSFSIKFMSGNNEAIIADSMYSITKYKIENGVETVWTNSLYPSDIGEYAIQVKFSDNLYSYKVEQGENSGEYCGSSAYIEKQDYVKFYYSIKAPLYLGWSFTKGNETLSIEEVFNQKYTGERQECGIRFFDANNPNITVNLINNIDYTIWYYQTKDGESYTKLLSAPSEPGKYVVELVFLRTLYDYKVSDEKGIPYSYIDAQQQEERFGQSLSTAINNILSSNLIDEKRYLKVEIIPTSILIGDVTVSDKSFDNTASAILNGKWNVKVDGEGVLVDSYHNKINELLNGRVIAMFDEIGVGEHTVSLYYRFLAPDSTSVLLKLPETKDIVGTTSYQFIKDGITNIKNSENYSLVMQELDAFEALVDEISACYNLTFADLTASITNHVVVINPKPFMREYDPFYKDSDNLEFSYSDELLGSLVDSEQIFVGNLSRENSETENKVGSYRILLGTLSLKDIAITLSNGEVCKLNECFALNLNDRTVYYTISKRTITVKITDGLSKYYDEDDPEMVCEVTTGNLISGDRLVYTGENKPIIQYGDKKARHDVGSYSISISPITIKNSQNTDVSSNYKIIPVKQEFTILPKAISIFVQEVTGIDYTKNFYAIYALNATDKQYVVQYDKNGIKLPYTFNEGFSLDGSFGLEQVADTNPMVCAKYRITLGNIGVIDQDGKSVTSNYILSQSNVAYYTIMKYNLVLELSGESYKKTYSSPDPIIALKQNDKFPLPTGCALREDSSATRAEGEAVGKYEIKNNDSSKIYIVDTASGEIITKYFYIVIRNEKNIQFEIEKYLLKVSVKEETFVKGDSTIIGELRFKDADGKNVPQSVLDKLSVTFDPIILDNPVEGINTVIPTYSDNVVDSNFEIVTETGVITVIFPENNVTYKTIDKDDKVMKSNSFILVDGKLLETKQMFLASTDNGKNPTKMITITIPVDSELFGKELYVVAVRSNGKYEMLKANVADGAIVVTDDEFNYIMVCSLKVWPYYLIGGIVLLIILGLVAFLLGRLARRKRRNGAKAINFRKVAKEKNRKVKLVETGGYKPNAEANLERNDLDDIVDVAPSGRVKLDSINKPAKKDKKNKADDDKKRNESPNVHQAETVETTPIAPVTQPKVETPKVETPKTEKPKVETPKIESSDDEIIIAPSRKLGEDTILADANDKVNNNVAPTSSNDDEIIISTSRKLLGDDDE